MTSYNRQIRDSCILARELALARQEKCVFDCSLYSRIISDRVSNCMNQLASMARDDSPDLPPLVWKCLVCFEERIMMAIRPVIGAEKRTHLYVYLDLWAEGYISSVAPDGHPILVSADSTGVQRRPFTGNTWDGLRVYLERLCSELSVRSDDPDFAFSILDSALGMTISRNHYDTTYMIAINYEPGKRWIIRNGDDTQCFIPSDDSSKRLRTALMLSNMSTIGMMVIIQSLLLDPAYGGATNRDDLVHRIFQAITLFAEGNAVEYRNMDMCDTWMDIWRRVLPVVAEDEIAAEYVRHCMGLSPAQIRNLTRQWVDTCGTVSPRTESGTSTETVTVTNTPAPDAVTHALPSASETHARRRRRRRQKNRASHLPRAEAGEDPATDDRHQHHSEDEGPGEPTGTDRLISDHMLQLLDDTIRRVGDPWFPLSDARDVASIDALCTLIGSRRIDPHTNTGHLDSMTQPNHSDLSLGGMLRAIGCLAYTKLAIPPSEEILGSVFRPLLAWRTVSLWDIWNLSWRGLRYYYYRIEADCSEAERYSTMTPQELVGVLFELTTQILIPQKIDAPQQPPIDGASVDVFVPGSMNTPCSTESYGRSSGSTQIVSGISHSAASARQCCIICMDADFHYAFFPCGHIYGCLECGPLVKTCPICRSDGTPRRVYYPS